MLKRIRVASLLAAVVLIAVVAHRASAQSLNGMSVGVTANAPIGDFGELVGTGFGIVLRTGVGGDNTSRWSGRGSFAFDYFGGNTVYSNVQFTGLGIDLVHRSRPTFYQFAGLGQYSAKYTLKSTGTSQFTSQRTSYDFGLSGGVGVNFDWSGNTMFMEFAATTVFTGTANSDWFPVRLGIRF